MTMPPLPTWYTGRDAVEAFLRSFALAGETRPHLVPTRANGQVAFGEYRWDTEKGALLPHAITLLTLEGREIKEITAFLTPEAFGRFSLPAELRP